MCACVRACLIMCACCISVYVYPWGYLGTSFKTGVWLLWRLRLTLAEQARSNGVHLSPPMHVNAAQICIYR